MSLMMFYLKYLYMKLAGLVEKLIFCMVYASDKSHRFRILDKFSQPLSVFVYPAISRHLSVLHYSSIHGNFPRFVFDLSMRTLN